MVVKTPSPTEQVDSAIPLKKATSSKWSFGFKRSNSSKPKVSTDDCRETIDGTIASANASPMSDTSKSIPLDEETKKVSSCSSKTATTGVPKAIRRNVSFKGKLGKMLHHLRSTSFSESSKALSPAELDLVKSFSAEAEELIQRDSDSIDEGKMSNILKLVESISEYRKLSKSFSDAGLRVDGTLSFVSATTKQCLSNESKLDAVKEQVEESRNNTPCKEIENAAMADDCARDVIVDASDNLGNVEIKGSSTLCTPSNMKTPKIDNTNKDLSVLQTSANTLTVQAKITTAEGSEHMKAITSVSPGGTIELLRNYSSDSSIEIIPSKYWLRNAAEAKAASMKEKASTMTSHPNNMVQTEASSSSTVAVGHSEALTTQSKPSSADAFFEFCNNLKIESIQPPPFFQRSPMSNAVSDTMNSIFGSTSRDSNIDGCKKSGDSTSSMPPTTKPVTPISVNEPAISTPTIESPKLLPVNETIKQVAAIESPKSVPATETTNQVAAIEPTKRENSTEPTNQVAAIESTKRENSTEPTKQVAAIESSKLVPATETTKQVTATEVTKPLPTVETLKPNSDTRLMTAIPTAQPTKPVPVTESTEDAFEIQWTRHVPATEHLTSVPPAPAPTKRENFTKPTKQVSATKSTQLVSAKSVPATKSTKSVRASLPVKSESSTKDLKQKPVAAPVKLPLANKAPKPLLVNKSLESASVKKSPKAASVKKSPKAASIKKSPNPAPVSKPPKPAPVSKPPKPAPANKPPKPAPANKLPKVAPVDTSSKVSPATETPKTKSKAKPVDDIKKVKSDMSTKKISPGLSIKKCFTAVSQANSKSGKVSRKSRRQAKLKSNRSMPVDVSADESIVSDKTLQIKNKSKKNKIAKGDKSPLHTIDKIEEDENETQLTTSKHSVTPLNATAVLERVRSSKLNIFNNYSRDDSTRISDISQIAKNYDYALEMCLPTLSSDSEPIDTLTKYDCETDDQQCKNCRCGRRSAKTKEDESFNFLNHVITRIMSWEDPVAVKGVRDTLKQRKKANPEEAQIVIDEDAGQNCAWTSVFTCVLCEQPTDSVAVDLDNASIASSNGNAVDDALAIKIDLCCYASNDEESVICTKKRCTKILEKLGALDDALFPPAVLKGEICPVCGETDECNERLLLNLISFLRPDLVTRDQVIVFYGQEDKANAIEEEQSDKANQMFGLEKFGWTAFENWGVLLNKQK